MENNNRSFEERKKEHLDSLKDSIAIFTGLTISSTLDDVAKDTLKILTDPKDERELKIAIITWRITRDTFLVKEDIPKLINIQNKIHCEIYGLYCGKCEIKTCNIDEKIKDA